MVPLGVTKLRSANELLTSTVDDTLVELDLDTVGKDDVAEPYDIEFFETVDTEIDGLRGRESSHFGSSSRPFAWPTASERRPLGR